MCVVPMAPDIDQSMVCDLVQSGFETGCVVVILRRIDYACPCILGQFLHRGAARTATLQKREKSILVAMVQALEGRLIAALVGQHQCLVASQAIYQR